jgi:hypothetical protein
MTEDWKSVANYTVVDRPEYFCDLEEFRRGDDQMMFIHLQVRKWSKETLAIAKREFNLLRQFVTCPLYGAGEVDDEKWSSFVKLFGFKFLQNVICTDGKTRRLFIHIKDDKKNEFKTNHPVVSTVNDAAVVRTSPVSEPSVLGSVRRSGESADSNPAH